MQLIWVKLQWQVSDCKYNFNLKKNIPKYRIERKYVKL